MALYAVFLLAFAVSLPDPFLDPRAQQFIFIIGIIGLWRYGWGGLHFLRSLIYRRFIFPRWRRRAEALGTKGLPDHVYLLVTSFRIPTDTSVRVYRAALREAIACGRPATLVASIVEKADENLIKNIYRVLDPPARVHLYIVRRPGTGKRDALVSGFRAIARLRPPASAVALVIDGDSILTPGCIARCAPLFALRERIGALTTDEICELHGGGDTRDDGGTGRVTELYRCWYSMRFAQRHILMSSMGLARRVLTLTGRMSMFRASIVVEPDFIDTIQNDYIEHWRLGRFRFLTGDDKSSWYYLLKNGWEMPYVPDVRIITVEEPPHGNFFTGATMLMMRWFGNMLRTNRRALALPRARMGAFVWWCLVDQRLSMWTSLFGISAALLGSLLYSIDILIVYVFWILFTRFLQTIMLLSARPKVSALYPLLLYFNQIYGSLVKIYMLSHLNRQKWTRQKTTLKLDHSALQLRLQHLFSNIALATSCLLLFCLIGFLSGLYDWQAVQGFLEMVF